MYQYLDLSDFSKYTRRNKLYYRNICNKCRVIQNRETRNNLDPLILWAKESLYNTKKRAKQRNIQHNLTRQWLLNNLPITCPVLNIPLKFRCSKNNIPTLDRFDNNKGYTTDNVRIISFKANRLKNNATLDELEAIVRYMKNS